MAGTLQLEVATPQRLLVKDDATEVYVPGADGMIGILPEHAALLSELGMGVLTYVNASGKHDVFIANGWLQVLHNHVRVLAERAEDIGAIDTARAERALKRAQERLAAPATAGVDVVRALNAMKRAEARLAASKNR